MNFWRKWVDRPAAALGLLCVIGCQPKPAAEVPLPQPTTLFKLNYFSGTALSGPVATTMPATMPATQSTTTTQATTQSLPEALSIRLSWIAMENLPATSFAPVGSRAVFFSSTGGGSAVLSVAELTRDACIADLNDPQDFTASLRKSNAGRLAPMATLQAALPAGVTADFAALDPSAITDPITGEATRRSLHVQLSRAANPHLPLQLSLVVKDLVGAKGAASSLRIEKAVFNLAMVDDIKATSTTALVIPFRFNDAAAKAVAVLVQISPGADEPAHLNATANCLAQLSASKFTTQPALATGEADRWSGVLAAVQSLSPPANRRALLAFLAEQTGAALCEDLAMEADDAVLDQLVKNIQTNVTASKNYAAKNPTADPNVGWLLDHTALILLAKRSDDAANGTGKISSELFAILTNHTGEVGRHSSSLTEVLRGLSTREQLNNRLLAQNTIFLEDSSPASRVRAYDWLNARHKAPPGYDPLSAGKARREALERAAGTP